MHQVKRSRRVKNTKLETSRRFFRSRDQTETVLTLDRDALHLRDSLGSTIVVVTHELASIFAIANNSVFLDTNTRTQGATGNPAELRDHSPRDDIRLFLNRGIAEYEEAGDATPTSSTSS